jgi:hypothetical protein
MLQLRKNPGKGVPGGHHFPEKENVFKADSFDELVDDVRYFRIHNGRPAGDVEQEILRHYQSIAPNLVEEAIDGALQNDTSDGGLADVMRWLVRKSSAPIKEFLDNNQAGNREKICANCRFNETLDDSDIEEEIVRRVFLLSRGKAKASLGWCRKKKWANGLAAVDPSVKQKDGAKSGCWAES